jgi:type II secretory pathway pseudopilin PulG
MINHIINQKGQSLVEALIALGVATLVISAMVVAVVTSVNNADYSKYENQATHYAQQGIEILQQVSQSNWSLFSTTYVGANCLGDPKLTTGQFNLTQLAICDSPKTVNVGTNFVRETNVTLGVNGACGNDSYYGEVTVYWNDGKCKEQLDTCFTNINPAQTL